MSKGNRSKIDNLGRVVIPKSIRKALNIESNSEISMYVENNKLIITKGSQICTICDTKDVSLQLKNKFLCNICIADIKDL
ncbi:MAG: AbrB/MazE/SpoVT family DNA-binding domain-containing protein [Candidatus Actinomarina sp.]|jgi:transcriptional pleiotropic regulator of transition state genes|nr:AbrB/MazE/SpoVT family DNA-binding domain-containing protein [Candidatus Actinomarinales bacterium]